MKRYLRFSSGRIILLLTNIWMVFPANLHAKNRMPRFEDYPIVQVYAGKSAPLVLSQEARAFRTRLKEASAHRPNFSGHYILTTWGCGMECLMGAVIDAITGEVYRLPFSVCCWGNDVSASFEPIEFRVDSSLIVFSGARNEQEGDVGKHFYTFDEKHHRFVPISSILQTSFP